VVGGGLIGVEVAEILRARGLQVTFVIRESWYFPLALDEQESGLVAEHMRAHGVDVRLRASVEEILRGSDGSVRGVRLESGDEIPCEIVVSAIGVVPNTKFLEGSGLALSKGGAIEVDAALMTSAPDVWAAGDCANVTWGDGSRRPEQLWYTAREQGRVAARAMLGDAAAYDRGTWYNSAKFFDLEWTTAGVVPVSLDWDDTPIAPAPGVRSWFQRVPGRLESQRIVVESERVVGFNMLGSRWNHERFLDWIRERQPLDWVLAHLGEAQFDEELSPSFKVY
jgi:NADPH-dependent 2,4-dienoyl-CoA reductase/sulfur reductase-like enzyme